MNRLVVVYLILISLAAVTKGRSQSILPLEEGEGLKYAAVVKYEGEKAATASQHRERGGSGEVGVEKVSGRCVLRRVDGRIRGSLFNEFGMTAIDFTYDVERKRAKIHHVIKMLDRWYIRRVVRKDLAKLMQRLEEGHTRYENKKRGLTYELIPLGDEAER